MNLCVTFSSIGEMPCAHIVCHHKFSIGSIKLDLVPQPSCGQCTMATITFPKHNHHSKLKDAHQPPTYPKAQPQLSLNQKCKKIHHSKKNLMLGDVGQDKQAFEDNLRFFQWEEEKEGEEEEEETDESTSTYSRENMIWNNQMTKLSRAP